MTVESNVSLVRRLIDEGWNQGRLEVLDELVAEDAVSGPDGPTFGRQAWKDEIAYFRSMFPDLRFDINDLFGADDRVALRWAATGTDTGGFMGRPPTGRRITSAGVDIYRIADGLLVQAWGPSGIVAELTAQLS
jgi:predicted ester cyclase